MIVRPPHGLADGTVPFCSPLRHQAADRIVFGPPGQPVSSWNRPSHAERVRYRIKERETARG